MNIERIAIIGLGELGNIVAEDLLANNEHIKLHLWDCQLDDVDSAAAAHWQTLSSHSRVQRASDAGTALQGCQLVLSAVTANQAIRAAKSCLPGLEPGAYYIDLNSVSPGTSKTLHALIGAGGGKFVEASVMSPILPKRCASPLLLGGPDAQAACTRLAQLGIANTRVASTSIGTASATKMCRSVIIKGIEALVTESLLAAKHYGVEEAVLESLDNLFPGPDWPVHSHYLISRSLQHGTRRAAEMREVVKTIDEAGIPSWMSAGAVQRHDWAAQFAAALAEESLDGLLTHIHQQQHKRSKITP